jgi:hypothetical protein
VNVQPRMRVRADEREEIAQVPDLPRPRNKDLLRQLARDAREAGASPDFWISWMTCVAAHLDATRRWRTASAISPVGQMARRIDASWKSSTDWRGNPKRRHSTELPAVLARRAGCAACSAYRARCLRWWLTVSHS